MALICNTLYYPQPGYSQDNDSQTACIELPLRGRCRLLPARWQPCAQDVCYSQPFVPGDVLHFQFQFPDELNNWAAIPSLGWRTDTLQTDWLLAVDVLDEADVETGLSLSSFMGRSWVGALEGERLQGLEVFTANMPSCFSLRFRLKRAGGGETVMLSEPFSAVQCQSSLLLEGLVPETGLRDCLGRVLAPAQTLPQGLHYLGNWFMHLPRLRLLGELALESSSWSSNTTNAAGLSVQATRERSWRFRGDRVPPYMIEQLDALLGAPQIAIDDRLFRFSGQIERNLDSGTMWLPDFRLAELPCRLDYSCGG